MHRTYRNEKLALAINEFYVLFFYSYFDALIVWKFAQIIFFENNIQTPVYMKNISIADCWHHSLHSMRKKGNNSKDKVNLRKVKSIFSQRMKISLEWISLWFLFFIFGDSDVEFFFILILICAVWWCNYAKRENWPDLCFEKPQNFKSQSIMKLLRPFSYMLS